MNIHKYNNVRLKNSGPVYLKLIKRRVNYNNSFCTQITETAQKFEDATETPFVPKLPIMMGDFENGRGIS